MTDAVSPAKSRCPTCQTFGSLANALKGTPLLTGEGAGQVAELGYESTLQERRRTQWPLN